MSTTAHSTDAPTDALNTPATTPVTNTTIAAQMAHRTIRAYTDEPLGEDTVTTLLDVARHAATSAFHSRNETKSYSVV